MASRAVVLYASSPDVLELAPVHFPAHKARLDEFAAAGTLVGVGTFGDPVTQGSMAIFTSRAAAEAFVAEDPFVLNGVVASYEIRDWDDALAPVA
jgi:uncharacterized protein YciI